MKERDRSGSKPGTGRATSRRELLTRAVLPIAGVSALGLGVAELTDAALAAPSPARDREVLNYLLSIEYLQAGFYAAAERHGKLRGELRTFAKVVGGHERAHIAFLRRELGTAARKQPKLDFAPASLAGDGFRQATVRLEELAIAAYNGQGANLSAKHISKVGVMVSVEARHAAWMRDIVGLNPAPRAADPGSSKPAVARRLKTSRILSS